VHVPGWRPDVTREEDLIEELARMRGYDTFPSDMGPVRPSNVPDDPAHRMEARLRRILTGLGLHEARGYSLGPKSGERAQAVLNPLSAEEGYLRTDLTSGLVRAVEHNWSVRERDVRLFEIGTVFHAPTEGERPQEDRMVAGVITGSRMPPHWSESGVSVDFDGWNVKSLLEEVTRATGTEAVVTASGDRWVLGGPSGEELGWAGRLEVDGPSWAAGVFGFEVRLTSSEAVTTRFVALPSMPPVTRDLALVLPDGVTSAQVGEVVSRFGGKLLESVDIFDEYHGAGIDGRSVAWRLVFRAATRTLRDKEVDAAVTNILGALRKQLGVERRAT
jgi:phenylalanyl-tRNA synthetase beta chain